MPMIIFSKNNGIIDRAMSILSVMGPLIYAVHVKLDRVQSLVFRPRARGLADDLRCKVKGISSRFPNYFSQCPCFVRAGSAYVRLMSGDRNIKRQ